MPNHSFSSVRERLLQGGVAPRHVERTLFELEGHFADLLAELELAGHSRDASESLATSRLGSDDVIVASVMARPELRSHARRWPWLVFGLLPLAALIGLSLTSLFLFSCVIEYAENSAGLRPGTSPILRGLAEFLAADVQWIIPTAVSGMCYLEAARRRASMKWPLTGTTVVALLAGLTQVKLGWSADAPKGFISGGFGFTSDYTGFVATLRAAFILTLTLIPYLWWQRTQKA
jgi:hypothetical protein